MDPSSCVVWQLSTFGFLRLSWIVPSIAIPLEVPLRSLAWKRSSEMKCWLYFLFSCDDSQVGKIRLRLFRKCQQELLRKVRASVFDLPRTKFMFTIFLTFWPQYNHGKGNITTTSLELLKRQRQLFRVCLMVLALPWRGRSKSRNSLSTGKLEANWDHYRAMESLSYKLLLEYLMSRSPTIRSILMRRHGYFIHFFLFTHLNLLGIFLGNNSGLGIQFIQFNP